MNNKVKRLAALLLAAILLFLCGCEKQKGGEKPFVGVNAPPLSDLAEKFANAHYKGDYKIMDSSRAIAGACFANGRFYYSAYNNDEEDILLTTELRSCLPDGSDDCAAANFAFTAEEYFAPAKLDKIGIYRIYPGNNCLYIVEYAVTSQIEENPMAPITITSRYILRQMDYSGNELSSVEYHGAEQEILRENSIAFDENGNIFYCDLNGIKVFAPDKTELFSLSDGRYYEILPRVEGYPPLISCHSSTGKSYDIFTVNLQKNCLEEQMRSVLGSRFFGGAEGFDLTCLSGTTLCGVSFDKKETVPIFILANGGIFSDTLEYILPYENGLVCVNSDYNRDASSWGLTALKRYDGGYSEEKTLLTLASGSSDISSVIYRAVIKFNQMSTDYAVEIKDYSVYGENGSAVLNTEILAGKTPDMFITDAVDYELFAYRGVLEDLLPYIDSDEALGGRDALIWPVFEAMRHKKTGALYQISPGFVIDTVVGDRRVLGDRAQSLDSITKAFEKMPPDSRMLNANITRQSALYQGMSICAEDYVNRKKGTCSFNSKDFEALLAFTKNFFPENIVRRQDNFGAVSDVKNGESLLARISIADFTTLSFAENSLEGNTVYLGWPGSKNAACGFSVNSGLAMCAGSGHKDAVWEFMRIVLLEEAQLSQKIGVLSLPTNRNVFEAQLRDASVTQEKMDECEFNGTDLPVMAVREDGSGSRTVIYKLTPEQTDALWRLIESPAVLSGCDSELWEIIEDEASLFFEGRLTAAEAADAIQRRAKIYLSERK